MNSLKSFVRNNPDMIEEDGNIYFICPNCGRKSVIKTPIDAYLSTHSREFHSVLCLSAE